ncbi:hypothetical protein WJX81_001375 [Elliptochloris bilobata]|uniref:Uso1/p115-like vesicle tethering protein C-terminal domain-containing protein n=1 Tax=Elliptochloris bilobata TaxID=381761 RepID=A0AAW1RQN1_9CHLO
MSQAQAAQTAQPSGFFGRLWGGKGAADSEGKKKPVKAKLGEKNTMFYDDELKMWRMPGEPAPANDAALPPPPSRAPSSAGASDAGSAQGEAAPGGARGLAARYAHAGLPSGGARTATPTLSADALAPKPPLAPAAPAFFVPSSRGAGGGAAGAAAAPPRYFVPGAGASSQAGGYAAFGRGAKGRNRAGERAGEGADAATLSPKRAKLGEPDAPASGGDRDAAAAEGEPADASESVGENVIWSGEPSLALPGCRVEDGGYEAVWGSEGGEAAPAETGPYGGYTWDQMQAWAAYYVEVGHHAAPGGPAAVGLEAAASSSSLGEWAAATKRSQPSFGKLAGPLPWDAVSERSATEEDAASVASAGDHVEGPPEGLLEGTPGGTAGEQRAPRLAGVALAEAAETAGGALAGWVTGLVRSDAVQSAVGGLGARFPRGDARRPDAAPPDSHSPVITHWATGGGSSGGGGGNAYRYPPSAPVSPGSALPSGAPAPFLAPAWRASASFEPDFPTRGGASEGWGDPGGDLDVLESGGARAGAAFRPPPPPPVPLLDTTRILDRPRSADTAPLPGAAFSPPVSPSLAGRPHSAGATPGQEPYQCSNSHPSAAGMDYQALAQAFTAEGTGPELLGRRMSARLSSPFDGVASNSTSPIAQRPSAQLSAPPDGQDCQGVAPAAAPLHGNGWPADGSADANGGPGQLAAQASPADDFFDNLLEGGQSDGAGTATGAVADAGAAEPPVVVPAFAQAASTAKASAAQQELDALRCELAEARAAVAAATAEKAELDARGVREAGEAALRAECDALQAERDALRADKARLEGELAEVAADIDAVVADSARLEPLQEERDALAAQLADALSAAAAAAAEAAALREHAPPGTEDTESAVAAAAAAAAAERSALAEALAGIGVETLDQTPEALLAGVADLGRRCAAAEAAAEEAERLRGALEAAQRRAAVAAEDKAAAEAALSQAREPALSGEAEGGAEGGLAERVAALTAEAEALAEEGLAKDEEIEALEGRLAHAAKEAAAQAAKLERLCAVSAPDDHEAAQLRAEVERLQADAARATASAAEAADLRGELAAACEAVQAAAADLQQARAERERLSAALAEAQRAAGDEQADALKADLSGFREQQELDFQRVGLLSEENALLQGRIDELEAAEGAGADPAAAEALAAARADSAAAAAKLSTAQQELHAAQAAAAAAAAHAAAAEADLAGLREQQELDFQRVGLLSEENALLQERLEELEAAAERADSDGAADMRAEAERLRERLEAMESAAAAFQAHAAEVDVRAAALAEEAGELRGRLADAEAALAARDTAPQAAGSGSPPDSDLGELRARLAALETEKAEWDSYAAAAEAAMDEDKVAAEAAAAAAAARESDLSARLAAAEEELAVVRAVSPSPSPAPGRDLSERLAEAEAEAAEAFERAAAAEEQAGAATAAAAAATREAAELRARMQDLEAGAEQARHAAAALEERDGAPTQAEFRELKLEFDDLTICLGQESAKVAALAELLQAHGVPGVDGLMAQVEAEYGFGDAADEDDEEPGGPSAEPPSSSGGGAAAPLEGLPEGEPLSPEPVPPPGPMQVSGLYPEPMEVSGPVDPPVGGPEASADAVLEGWDGEEVQGDWGA